ncbi:MAG: DNA adenine methylase [Desulfovibrio sp.]|nr:DNA adenine methylase [Desulfovibrio sp.]
MRLARVYVECLPYHEVIKRYDKPTTAFYIDPPYWDCENYYGKGLFCREDFTVLAELMGKIEGKSILSLNDKPEVRELFSAFKLEEVKVNYTCSNGKNLKAGELIFRNFD